MGEANRRLMRAGHPPPAAGRDHGPDRFDESKGPGALQKAVDGAESTGKGESENEPRATVFKRRNRTTWP
jgi:hypothetical protein